MRANAQEWLTGQLGIEFPYVSMGKVDSLDLFGPNELIIFSFYQHNRNRYRNALDIGANLGLHTILMQALDWDVHMFEPDREIYDKAMVNIANNGYVSSWMYNAAVSDRDGEASFVRVLQNLTGSHLEGFKESYGPRETVSVKVMDCRSLFDWADIAKLDVEGHEGVLLQCVTDDHLEHLDLLCELRGHREAAEVLAHFQRLETPIYTQKNGWQPAQSLEDMPTKHQEGSIFISRRGGPFQ